jgi:hypothetical protein
MKVNVVRVDGTVTAASATAMTVTPTVVRGNLGATVTTVVVNGTALSGNAVGDRVTVTLESR